MVDLLKYILTNLYFVMFAKLTCSGSGHYRCRVPTECYQNGRRSCGAVGGQGGLPLAGSCLKATSDWPSSKEDSR